MCVSMVGTLPRLVTVTTARVPFPSFGTLSASAMVESNNRGLLVIQLRIWMNSPPLEITNANTAMKSDVVIGKALNSIAPPFNVILQEKGVSTPPALLYSGFRGKLRMNRVLAPIAFIALSGCVASNAFVDPSGAQVQTTKCNTSPQACFQRATETCGGPYQVIDSHSNAGGLLADFLPGPVAWYSMTYRCGQSDGQMPRFAFRGPNYTPPAVVVAPAAVVAPTPVPTTTNCQRFGDQVTCRSF
jgi:hypothetical protein